MSFLNPVNEPVLRFSSTDANAPQINYAARAAGDVKAVIKACLVTGYGSRPSAGWSIVNEVNHVAEFISPSAAMSDYKIKIDDSLATSTKWNYLYQGALENFGGGVLSKNSALPYKPSADNRWDLIVSARGFYFIETIRSQYDFTVLGSSVLYFGPLKADKETINRNMAFWCVGFNSDSIGTGSPTEFFKQSVTLASKHISVTGNLVNYDEHTQIMLLTSDSKTAASSELEIWSNWYYRTLTGQVLLQQVGVLLHARSNTNTSATNLPTELNGRPVAVFMPIRGVTLKDQVLSSSRALIAIYLDSWEY